MNNIKRFPRFVKSFQVQDVIPSQEVRCSPRKFISSLNANKKKVLNYLLFMGNRYQDVYLRQDTIAKVFKLSRETVNRIISYLCELNLINKVTRYNKSCLYRISSWFLETDTRARLKDMLFSLTFIPLLYLYAGSSSHDIIKGEFNNKQYANTVNYDYKESVSAICSLHIAIAKKEKIERVVMAERTLHEKIADDLQLDAFSMKRLTQYSDSILRSAYRTVQTAKNLNNKAGFFFGTCKKLQDQIKTTTTVPKTEATQFISDNFGLQQELKGMEKIPMPPSHSPYKSAAREEEKLTEEQIIEKSAIANEMSKQNPFYAFVVTALANKFTSEPNSPSEEKSLPIQSSICPRYDQIFFPPRKDFDSM